jgi:hypothetical protein
MAILLNSVHLRYWRELFGQNKTGFRDNLALFSGIFHNFFSDERIISGNYLKAVYFSYVNQWIIIETYFIPFLSIKYVWFDEFGHACKYLGLTKFLCFIIESFFANFQVASPTFHLLHSKLPSRAKLSMIVDQNAFYNVPRDILRYHNAFYLIKIGPLVLK